MADPLPRVIVHLGSDLSLPGGVATVITGQLRSRSTNYRHAYIASWAPGTARHRARSFASACFLLWLRDRRSTWAFHLHLTQGGDLLRASIIERLAKRRRIPVVLTIHGSRFLAAIDRHPRLVNRVMTSASTVTCLSAEVGAAVATLTGRPPVRIHNSVSIPVEVTSATPGLVVFAGEVGTRKGVDVLRQAWTLVHRDHPAARLIVVGPLAEPTLVDALPVGMEYQGVVSAGQISRLLSSASLFVLPSRAETLPMALLEAMAHGVPFVSTRVGAIGDLEVGGRLVAPQDAEALAEQISDLLRDDDARHRLGQAGRALVESSYTRASLDDTLTSIYDELATPR
jgi:glycosyltransferase involved in cell wall biosynthesis